MIVKSCMNAKQYDTPTPNQTWRLLVLILLLITPALLLSLLPG
ncbi:MAG: hypothetical protein AAGF89_15480 [Bacteroidota bacterium]